MDGRGYWHNKAFVERPWKSVKYEEVHLHGYETVSAARQFLVRYFNFYNRRRPHSALDEKTPDMAYFNQPPLAVAAQNPVEISFKKPKFCPTRWGHSYSTCCLE